MKVVYIRYSNFANFDDLYETKLKNCCLKYVIRLKTEIYQKFYSIDYASTRRKEIKRNINKKGL